MTDAMPETQLPVAAYDCDAEEEFGVHVVRLDDLCELYDRRHRGDEDALALTGGLDHERPHRVDFYTLIFVTTGTGRHDIDFTPHYFRPGSVLLTSVGQVQQFHFDGNVSGLMLLFAEPFLLRNLGQRDAQLVEMLYNYEARHPLTETGDDDDVARTLEDLVAEFESESSFGREEMLWSLLKRLLILIQRASLNDRESHQGGIKRPTAKWSPIFLEFRTLVAESYHASRTVQDYASKLGVSARHLTEVSRDAVGVTAKRFIDDTVTLEAKRRLAVDETPVGLIASQLGFDEASGFVRFFKNQVGATPSAFRHSLDQPGRPL